MNSLFARVAGLAALGLAAIAAVAACPPLARADLVLNEVLYDPAGADLGAEFVEIWNPDPIPRSLAGVTVETGDGASPGAWVVVYRGAAEDTVAPGRAFLVAGAALTGALQNGPDAVRLSRDGAPLDLLGYGDLDAASLYEGAPAPDVASGHSLARVVDGRDEGRNAGDWGDEPAPTPGRANHPDARLAIAAGSVTVTPAVPWPGERVSVAAALVARGRLALDGARWRLVVEREGAGTAGAAAAFPLAEAPGTTLAAGESARVVVAFDAPPPGPMRLLVRAEATLPGDPAAADLADSSRATGRCVAGPAVVNEIAFKDRGAGEWIELWLRDAIADARSISIADGSSTPRALAPDSSASPAAAGAAPGGAPLAAGSRLVVAEDPAAFRARFAIDPALLFGVDGGWAALNDTDGPAGVADRVRVFVSGEPADDVPYDARAASRGGSLERLSPDLPGHEAGSWGECVDPAGGTPGRENSLRAPDGAASRKGDLIRASGRLVRGLGAGAPLLIRLTPEARGRTLDVVVRDLLGRAVRTLVRGQRFASEGAFAWDGRDDGGAPVPPGLYVVRAEAAADGARGPSRTSLAVAVAPGGGAR